MSLQKCFFLTDSYNPNEPEDEWTLVYEKTTAGSDTLNLGWGKYKIEASAGGGGGAAALGGFASSQGYFANSAGASGGTGAYGSAIIEYTVNSTDTLTFTVGAGGTGATKTNGTAASTGGGNTTLSDSTHGSNFVVLNGGGSGYAHATNNGDTATVGTGGTFTTTLATHSFNNGRNGASRSTSSGNHSAGNTTNPSPYNSVGFGGGWAFNTQSSVFLPSMSGSNGGAGFIRIYKSQVYPKGV